MGQFVKLPIVLISLVLFALIQESVGAGCTDNESCTDLCGYAGEGTCVDGKYCKCATCPQRNVWELVNIPKICTIDPICHLNCPASSVSLTNGKLYSGHRCLSGTSLVCICFCMPTTPQSLLDVVKCPFYNRTQTTPPSTL